MNGPLAPSSPFWADSHASVRKLDEGDGRFCSKLVEFEMHRQKSHTTSRTLPRLWLAADNGVRLAHSDEVIGPADEPEAVLDVEFEGLTEDEQRRALAAFPGGRRFRLAHH